jgi:hypothetical protein
MPSTDASRLSSPSPLHADGRVPTLLELFLEASSFIGIRGIHDPPRREARVPLNHEAIREHRVVWNVGPMTAD